MVLALDRTSLAHFIAIPDSQIYREVVENGWFDSAYGDIFYVKHPEISKAYLNYISKKVERDLIFIVKKDKPRSIKLFKLYKNFNERAKKNCKFY